MKQQTMNLKTRKINQQRFNIMNNFRMVKYEYYLLKNNTKEKLLEDLKEDE